MGRNVNGGTRVGFVLVDVLGSTNIPSFPVIVDHHDVKVLPCTRPDVRGLGAFVMNVTGASDALICLSNSMARNCLGMLPPILVMGQTQTVVKNHRDE